MAQLSSLRNVSIGRVARDIIEDDMYVDIHPVELQPVHDGELTVEDKQSNQVTDSAGNVDIIAITRTSLVKAKWLPDGDTNRLEPPTVCKGEVVRLYQFDGSDEYYWKTLYNQLELRKLEKRTIIVSNKKSIAVAAEDLLKHSYYYVMDTINKLVHLHTSTTDEEYTGYDLAIDTKDGLLEITDAKGNKLLLESQEDRWTLSSVKEIVSDTEDRYITNRGINKEDTAGDKTTDVGGNTNHNTVENRTVTVGKDDSLTVDGNKRVTIAKRYDINVSNFTVDNGSDELLAVLTELTQAVTMALGVGNFGAPVPMDGPTQAKLAAIKAKLQGFI